MDVFFLGGGFLFPSSGSRTREAVDEKDGLEDTGRLATTGEP